MGSKRNTGATLSVFPCECRALVIVLVSTHTDQEKVSFIFQWGSGSGTPTPGGIPLQWVTVTPFGGDFCIPPYYGLGQKAHSGLQTGEEGSTKYLSNNGNI